MKWPNAPLLERITYVLAQPVAWALWLWYARQARSIHDWYAHQWQWNEEDCNVFFIAAEKEWIEEQHEAELEEAYLLYVDMCRPFGVVPRAFIDRGETQ